VILNDVLPEEMPFVNGLLKKKGLTQLVQYCYLRFGLQVTVKMLDEVKNLGFLYATRAGISIGWTTWWCRPPSRSWSGTPKSW